MAFRNSVNNSSATQHQPSDDDDDDDVDDDAVENMREKERQNESIVTSLSFAMNLKKWN
jgi:hypothetical protein